MALTEEEQSRIISKCKDFLERSDERFASIVEHQEECLEALGGKFWEQRDLKKKWKIGKKPVIHHDIFSKIINGVSSPYSSSPFHINLDDQSLKVGEELLQDKVNTFESVFSAKISYQQAFKRCVGVGAGFIVIGIDEYGLPMLEFAHQQSSIAFDPNCKTPDGSDAEEGATIRYISLNKAQADFGFDVIPSNYPNHCSGLDLSNCAMWGNKERTIQIVNYYVKEKNGVVLYKICGNKIVADPILMPIDRIPIVRFAGYASYDKENGIDYDGIVQRLWDAQLSYDLVWTKQLTRLQESVKAKAVVGLSAIKGVAEQLKALGRSDLEAFVYNDLPDKNGHIAEKPDFMKESFNTADLMDVLTNIRSCIPDVSGIPLDGITNVQRTATEVLTQQVNNESNVQELYTNAECANITIGRIVVMLLNNGVYSKFSLENGPAIITSNMKRRQEINAIAQFYPDDKKMLLAIPMSETINSDMAKAVENFTKANLPDGLSLPNDDSVGAIAYALKQTQAQFKQAIDKANELNASNIELQKQVDELAKANADMKQQMALDWAKFRVETNLKVKQTNFENELEMEKFGNEQDKLILEAQKIANDNKIKTAEAIIKATK